MRKAVLKKFALFTQKLQTLNFIKKRLQHRYFPLNIAKFLKTGFHNYHKIAVRDHVRVPKFWRT